MIYLFIKIVVDAILLSSCSAIAARSGEVLEERYFLPLFLPIFEDVSALVFGGLPGLRSSTNFKSSSSIM